MGSGGLDGGNRRSLYEKSQLMQDSSAASNRRAIDSNGHLPDLAKGPAGAPS